MRVIFLILIFLFNLNAYEIYKDLDSNLGIDEILTKEFEKKEDLNFGATKSTIWIKFKLENSENYDIEKFLHINLPFLESVNLYEIGKNIKISKNGVTVPIENRDIKTHHILFKITIKANSEKDIYLRVNSRTAKFIVSTFYEKSKIISFLNIYSAFIGGYLSILGVLFIYNFFIYLYLREKVYLYYIIYIGVFLIHQLFFTAFILNFLNVENYYYLFFTFIITLKIVAILFIRSILETKKNLKILDKVLIFFLFTIFLEFILLAIDTVIEVKFHSITTMLLAVLALIVAIVSVIKGVRGAKIFLIAWIIFLVSVFITGLSATDIIPTNFFVSNALQIGSVTEVVLFSLILAYRVNILKEEKIRAISELSQKDKLLHIQSKFATIGETLCNIEHQWRTPLSRIGSKIGELEVYLDYKGVPNREFLDNFTKDTQILIEYMSKTVSDFRNFYTPTSKAKEFYLKDSIYKAISLMDFFSEKHNIKINLDMSINPIIYGYESEFSQVILNILSNAKDIFIERKIKNPQIDIYVIEVDKKIEIKIIDNGGGIDSEVIDKIFDPFYSQKLQKSTGLGLYMSKVIIEERMRGKLEVKNIQNGSEFTLLLKD